MRSSLASWLLALLFSASVAAQPAPESAIPPALKDWRAWALKDLEYRSCPFLASSTGSNPTDFICAWPGRLTLSTTADGAAFSIRWRVEAQSWIALPGDAEYWPQQVQVDGQRQPVITRAEAPALLLPPGTHDISGRIAWRERPQTLSVPTGIGLNAKDVVADG